MDVRPGYKRTEVEVIPQEWVITSLIDCCKKITDGTHDTPRPVKKGVPFLTAIHVKDNRIAYDECLFVSKADHEIIFKRCNPEKGDVLLVNIGAGVATTALVEVDYEFSLKNVALLKPDSARVLGVYLSYCLAKKKEGITQALLSGGAQPFLSLTQIGQIRISAPPLPEQRAIAEALSDADTLIESLEQLLTKKRQIKKGSMQELLTGKKRLPGFSEEWEMKSLGEMGKCYRGVSYNPSVDLLPFDTDTTARLLRSNNVQRANVVFLDMQYVDIGRVSSEQRLRPRDILICMANGNRDLVGKAGQFLANDGFEYTFGAFMGCFRPNDQNADLDFVFYLFQTEKYRRHIGILLAGSSINNLTPGSVEGFFISAPSDKAEQAALATILSDMDAEIAALEAKVSKVRQLKQGMMQELLTGRVQLVKPTHSVEDIAC